MSTISGSSEATCQSQLETRLARYFSLLDKKLRKKGVKIQFPFCDFQKQRVEFPEFPKTFAIPSRISLRNSEEIKSWMERYPDLYGFNFPDTNGRIFGWMKWQIESIPHRSNHFQARLGSYSYYYFQPAKGVKRAFAVRAESDPFNNSFYFNHPLHHFQVLDFENPRFASYPPYTLTAFVDYILRMFYRDLWQEIYPEIFKFFHELMDEKVVSSDIAIRIKTSTHHRKELKREMRNLRQHSFLVEEKEFYSEIIAHLYQGEV